MHEFTLRTRQRTQFISIDQQVQRIVGECGLENGVVHVYVPHTTAAVTINENADPDVMADVAMVLDRTAPWQAGYAHTEGNSAAHAKASMLGSSAAVFVREGRLALGTWQSIYFCEFDGPRTRTVWVQVTPA